MRFRTLLLLLILHVPTGPLTAQFGSAAHAITVSVNPLSYLLVVGGAVSLNISDAEAVAGQDAMTVTNQATSISWGTNSGAQKITAVSSLGTPQFSLNLLAQTPTAGVAGPELTLSTTAANLLVNIGRSRGTATLRYTGIALASLGTGTDNHSVTFTIQSE